MDAALRSGDLGRVLQAYRVHPFHGQPLPQSVIADWLHISQSTLSRIENGKRRLTVDDIAGFARALCAPMALRWDAKEDLGIGSATLEALHATVERLCRDYSTAPAAELQEQTEPQLGHVHRLLEGRTTLSQHRELLVIGGWLSALLSCLNNDLGKRPAAEAARDDAYHFGKEAGHPVIVRWVYELQSWFALTDGRFRDVTMFARAGQELGVTDSATVQLTLQEAKGWAKLGDRRQAEDAVERGRSLLDRLPPSADPRHHFVWVRLPQRFGLVCGVMRWLLGRVARGRLWAW